MVNRTDYHLRPLGEEDLERVLTWRNSDRVRSCMYTDELITREEHYRWYNRDRENPQSIHRICEFQSHPFGVINATKIDFDLGTCAWGFYLGDTSVPKGSSYAMALAFLDFIFQDLKLNEVKGEALAFNADSLKFHHNLGFQPDGILADRIIKQGQSIDVICFRMSSQEWKSVRVHTEARLFSN
jgi:UDP-4-amino-4,6-dideoxy-N-acetyl-beta-L-altrosamine N-acetyltransferase